MSLSQSKGANLDPVGLGIRCSSVLVFRVYATALRRLIKSNKACAVSRTHCWIKRPMCLTTLPSRCKRSIRSINASCWSYVKRPRRVNESVVTSLLTLIRRRLSMDVDTVLWYIYLDIGSLASSSFCGCEMACASGAVHKRRCSLVSGPCVHNGQL